MGGGTPSALRLSTRKAPLIAEPHSGNATNCNPTSSLASPLPPPADNYCFYVDNYDSLGAAYDWARQTLEDHRNDKREHVYTRWVFLVGQIYF